MANAFTVSLLSSLQDNEIKDLKNVEKRPEELRILNLVGEPVRIELTNNYVEANHLTEKINLEKYKAIFTSLYDFFYNTTYLYGYIYDGNLTVYDIFTNSNYLSTRDLKFIEDSFGLPIEKPLSEGRFNFTKLVDLLNTFSSSGIDINNIHILPSVYVDDKNETIKPVINSTVILGEKKSYYGWTNTTNTKNFTVVPPKVKTYKVFETSDKLARTNIYKEVLKNIELRLISSGLNNREDYKVWWNKKGKFFAHLYAIHTLPATRKIIYDYAKTYEGYAGFLNPNISDKWAEFFIDFFLDEYDEKVVEKGIDFGYPDIAYASDIFKEEFDVFDAFFKKEADKDCDWTKNFNYYDIYGEN